MGKGSIRLWTAMGLLCLALSSTATATLPKGIPEGVLNGFIEGFKDVSLAGVLPYEAFLTTKGLEMVRFVDLHAKDLSLAQMQTLAIWNHSWGTKPNYVVVKY